MRDKAAQRVAQELDIIHFLRSRFTMQSIISRLTTKSERKEAQKLGKFVINSDCDSNESLSSAEEPSIKWLDDKHTIGSNDLKEKNPSSLNFDFVDK